MVDSADLIKIHKFPKKGVFFLLSLLLLALGLLALILFQNIHLFFTMMFFATMALPHLITLTRLLYLYKRKNSEFYSVSMFHSAEHMVINAYTALQRIPTLEEVKNTSPIAKHCGSNDFFAKLLYGVSLCIWFAIFSNSNLIYCIGIMVLLVLYFLCMKYRIHRGMQRLILSKPTDEQLLLAIEALKNFEEMEEKLESDAGVDIIFNELVARLPKVLGPTFSTDFDE